MGQARKMPITGRSMVDAERLLELVDQMRLATSRATLQEAQEVLERREQIVNQTMLDARRIRATAEGDAPRAGRGERADEVRQAPRG